MNEVLNINNVRGYLDKETGTAYLNAGDVARGFGFIQRQNKGGKEYVSIRWDRVNQYLHDFGFPPQVGETNLSKILLDALPPNRCIFFAVLCLRLRESETPRHSLKA